MQRGRFFFNLGCLAAAVMLMIAAIAFGPGGVFGVGLGIGIAGLVASLAFIGSLVHQRRLLGARELRVRGRSFDVWSLLAGGVAGVAVWQTVQAAVFDFAVARWLTLADGVIVAALACTGLILHERTTERVVHVLQVVHRSER